MVNPRTFFDFSVGHVPLGRVVFELFNDVVPRTAENFRALCTGEKGVSPSSSIPLHYKGSPVHRIIDGFMIQGGDFTKRNGTGGESIYGGQFEDEMLEGDGSEVDREGLLVMANRGPDTNGSQYFVTLAPAQHLTGKHVVFGRVVNGLNHILTLGKLPTDSRDRPISPVLITHCGELELRRPAAPPVAPIPAARESRPRSPDSQSSRSRSPSPRRRRRYSASSGSAASEEDEKTRRRREKKEKKERKRERKEAKRAKRKGGHDGEVVRREGEEETEAELDARLEREEKERLEKQRLEREQRQEEEARRIKENGGIVRKGKSIRYSRGPSS
ncbi:cyclophilin-like domain-containing protein [Dioszegia hungarica]|uniref:peptidylprolyl isomerase n=1 Tax=Dioszegia hungarica TaxID=4972 RepID=A0AA38H8M7_9TREE|nr:cyclophilin-like domain-containing protein [Dioszegia hungarica]KAI9635795.1 cyclophilin-like domain-containing protein [Dioszegia hungarica]